MSKNTKTLAYGALFIVLAIVTPIIFHSIGMGSVFLPMFLPILLAGFFIELPFVLLVGFLAPWTSALITGMPPFFPTAMVMSVECLVMTGVVSYLFYIKNRNPWICTVFALLADRLIVVLMTFAIAPLLNLPAGFFAVTTLLYSLLGVAINLIAVPLILNILQKFNLINKK